jgi:hypothetical protein
VDSADADCTTLLGQLFWSINKIRSATPATQPLPVTPKAGSSLQRVGLATSAGVDARSFSLVFSAPPNPAGAGTGTRAPTSCDQPTFEAAGPYDAKGNAAVIVTSLSGIIYDGDLSKIDEDDTIYVRVLVPASLVDSVQVRRVSPQRTIGAFRIVGGGTQVDLQADTGEQCIEVPAVVSAFEPGNGQIEISVRDENGEQKRSGLIEFNVNPLYRGIFSFGGAWSSLQDPEFKLLSREGGTLITRGEQGANRLLYALFFTPFIWGQRDIEKDSAFLSPRGVEVSSFLTHLNPTVGFAVNDPLENAFLGVSLDLFDGILVTGGVHVGHVSVIDPNSGLTEGVLFNGTVDQVPTAKDWRARAFWSVSLDLRAAVQLIRAVLGISG